MSDDIESVIEAIEDDIVEKVVGRVAERLLERVIDTERDILRIEKDIVELRAAILGPLDGKWKGVRSQIYDLQNKESTFATKTELMKEIHEIKLKEIHDIKILLIKHGVKIP